ncbi:hypothetical protein ACHAWX_000177, partial [Stephanocyclus meneghinianus]
CCHLWEELEDFCIHDGNAGIVCFKGSEANHIIEDSTKHCRQSNTCVWINVIYDCNERCTYCIVPTTMGVKQSWTVESLLEVKELVDMGFIKRMPMVET